MLLVDTHLQSLHHRPSLVIRIYLHSLLIKNKNLISILASLLCYLIITEPQLPECYIHYCMRICKAHSLLRSPCSFYLWVKQLLLIAQKKLPCILLSEIFIDAYRISISTAFFFNPQL